MKKNFLLDLTSAQIFLYSMIFLSLILVFFIVKPFIGIVAFTFLLAAYFYPMYKKFLQWFKGRKGLASFITGMVILLVIIIPITVFFVLIINQVLIIGTDVVSQVKAGTISLTPQITFINNLLARIPFVEYRIAPETIMKTVVANSQGIIQTGTDILVMGSRTAFNFFEQLAVFLFLLFGIFPLLEPMKRKVSKLSPLPDNVDAMIFSRLYDMGKAVFAGIIFVGFAQSLCGGIGFLIAGVPAAALWILAMLFLSIIPGFGPGFVLVPTVIILLLSGHIWQSIVMFIAFLFATNIDNYLRPLLVGKQTSINPILLIIAILGGLKLFGIIGVFFGPMALAFALTLLEAYEKHYVSKPEQTADIS